MFFADFDAYLRKAHGDARNFYDVIWPQIKKITSVVCLSVKDQIQDYDGAEFRSFHLFGFDLMITHDFRVVLIEVNASPAVAADLMPAMTEDLVHYAIDPCFPPLSDTPTRCPEIAKRAALAAAKYKTTKQTLDEREERDDEGSTKESAEPSSEVEASPPSLPCFKRGFETVYRPE